MELYKNYCTKFFIILFFINLGFSEDNIKNIINFSYIDFSVVSDSDFRFNIGTQSNDLVDGLHYFSFDKLLSDNLIGSIKISKYSNRNYEIYNQNTLSLIPENSLFKFIVGINYVSSNQLIYKWLNYGILFNYSMNNDNSLISGVYFDVSDNNDKPWSTFSYYLCANFSITKKLKNLLSIKYNPKYSVMNQSFELSISL